MQVLTQLAEGLAKKEIAEKLHIGNSTVVTHVAPIDEELNLLNVSSAISKAYRLCLFPAEA